MPMTEIDEALNEAQTWLDEEGIVAVGQGEEKGQPVVDVWVTSPDVAARIPRALRGVPVRVRDSGGEIVAGS
jgi:hypothetical protein